jgi:3-methylfumaryl-CoA hydratase
MTDFTDPPLNHTESAVDFVAPTSAAALAATLDCDAALRIGDPLPHLWHWIFFRSVVRQSQIATDGHPVKGSFLPDLGLPRRMWAGGRLRFHSPLRVGTSITRASTIVNAYPEAFVDALTKAGYLSVLIPRNMAAPA